MDRTASSRKTLRARILLKADAGPEGPEWSDTKIADAFEVSRQTVERLRKRAVTEGMDGTLQKRRRDTVALATSCIRALAEHHSRVRGTVIVVI